MESQYQAVCTIKVNDKLPESEIGRWTPFLRQLHIGSGVWTVLFMMGLCAGAPTVFVPQLRKELNGTHIVDDELASWLYSVSNLSAMPWIFILPSFSHFVGRKIPYLSACIAMSTVNVILIFSSTPYQILVAQIIQGFVNASNVSFILHITPEYCSPKYRVMFFNIQAPSFYWGIWVANAIGTYFYWKYISVVGVICSLYSLTVMMFPESPRWLASKGKLRECEKAHRWLRGSSPESEKELRELIKNQNEYQAHDRKNIKNWHSLVKTVRCKQFYFPLFLTIVIGAQYNFSGKFVCSIYAIDIIKKITNSEQAAYTGMLILDGVTVFGMYFGSFLSRLFRIRTFYLGLSFLSVVFMLLVSLYLYLAKIGVIVENQLLSLSLLVAYSLSLSCGPIFLSMSIYSEIISIRYQAVSYMFASFLFVTLCTGMLKFSPIIFKEFGMHGSFLLFGLSSGVCTLLLYIYLPETKNKTLLEIEECFRDGAIPTEANGLVSRTDDDS